MVIARNHFKQSRKDLSENLLASRPVFFCSSEVRIHGMNIWCHMNLKEEYLSKPMIYHDYMICLGINGHTFRVGTTSQCPINSSNSSSLMIFFARIRWCIRSVASCEPTLPSGNETWQWNMDHVYIYIYYRWFSYKTSIHSWFSIAMFDYQRVSTLGDHIRKEP